MKKFVIQVVFLLAVSGAAYYFTFPWGPNGVFYSPSPAGGNDLKNAQQLKVGASLVKIELANTTELRAKGLGGRDSLDPDSGMLFVFEKPGKYQFWMKGMKFPLDLIYIREAKVVDILEKVPPPQPGQTEASLARYQPVTDVDMVLEVNAGFVASHTIKVGDKVFLIQASPQP